MAPIPSFASVDDVARRKKTLIRIAAIGALIAWLFNRKKNKPAPEGIWQDVTPEP